MPTVSTRTSLARQWEILQQLPTKPPGITTAALRQRLEDAGHKCTKRTIERDLLLLEQLFPLHCNSKGTPYGWHWMEGKSLNVPGLSLGEALSLSLLEGSLEALLPRAILNELTPRFSQARDKLSALAVETPAARLPQRVAHLSASTVLQPPQIDPDIAATVLQALVEGKQLQCIYRSASKRSQQDLVLNPLAMVQRGQTRYLLATGAEFVDVRMYALHRLQSAEALPTAVSSDTPFDLATYLAEEQMQFGVRGKIALRAWVKDQLAHLLLETPISDDMQLTPLPQGGGFQLSATVSDSWELKWWLLARAGQVVVTAPASLREELAQRLNLACEQYRDNLPALEDV